MKVKIRKNVFETNSSSMHSLASVGSDRMNANTIPTTDIDGEEKIVVEPGEYGWSGPPLCTPIEKLSYIVTMIGYKDSVWRPDKIHMSPFFEWLSEMVKDYTGYALEYQPSDGYSDEGYIDHQSTDTLDEFWSYDSGTFKDNMRDLVFNDKYFIVIDNDNY